MADNRIAGEGETADSGQRDSQSVGSADCSHRPPDADTAPRFVAWPPSPPWIGPGSGYWATPGYGYAPGYSYAPAPALPPIPEEPRRLHPATPRRPFLSVAGRTSPKLYLWGLLLTIPSLCALLSFEIAIRIGMPLDLRPYGGWVLLEATSIVAAAGLIACALAQTHQRRADGWTDYFGPSPLLVVALVLALSEAIVTPIALTKQRLDLVWSTGEQILVATLVLSAIYVTIVHFLGVRTGALSWHDVVRPGRLAPDASDWQAAPVWPAAQANPSRSAAMLRNLIIDFGLPVVLLIPLIVVTFISVAILLAILGPDVAGASSPVTSTWRQSDALLVFVAAAVIAPIGEETLFRGLVTNAWARSLGRRQAILRAALFFAAIHIYNISGANADIAFRADILAFAARIPVSFVLSWLYVRRRSIVASAAMHMAYNGTLLLITLSQMPR